MAKHYVVYARRDGETGTWYAWSDDVPGLATGADAFEQLSEKLSVVIPELIAEVCPQAEPEIDYSVQATYTATARIDRAA